MGRLRLDNFEDFFDPGALARGRVLFEGGAVTGLALEDDLWSVRIRDDEEETGEAWPGVELDRHDIFLAICDCAEYDEDRWERKPCRHIAALCYALRENMAKKKAPGKRGRPPRDAEKAAVKRVKKTPARKKDPAVALLDELEAAEVIEFVRQALAQGAGSAE
jgi:hypothetical protein